MSEPHNGVQHSLQHELRRLTIATAALYVVIIALLLFDGWWTWHTAAQTHRQNKALCAYRNDLQARVATNSVYLANPESFGLSKSAVQILRNTDVNQRNTIHALSGLGC